MLTPKYFNKKSYIKCSVIGGDQVQRGREFQSLCRILDGLFFTLKCRKNCFECLKRPKINKNSLGCTFLKISYISTLKFFWLKNQLCRYSCTELILFQNKKLPGFELQISAVGSDRSAHCATTDGQKCFKFYWRLQSHLRQMISNELYVQFVQPDGLKS